MAVPSSSRTIPPRQRNLFRFRHRHETLAAGAGTLKIGRHAGSDLVLNDPRVSRHHARIVIGAQSAAIEDEGSANGVFVNGRRIRGLHQLHIGDRIEIGEQIIEVLGYPEDEPDAESEDTQTFALHQIRDRAPNGDWEQNTKADPPQEDV